MRNLRAISLLSLGLIVGYSELQVAFANEWPKLKPQKTKYEQCDQALNLAKKLFKSDAFYLYAPLIIPDDFSSVKVLGVNAVDISGGDDLIADDDIFEKIPRPSSRSLYWQKKSKYGHRLVVMEDSVGWRGDRYSVFVIDKKHTSKEMKTALNERPIISGGWRPPWIFRYKKSDDLWLIQVAEPYNFPQKWQVMVDTPSGMKSACSISFFHVNFKEAKDVLTKPMRKLEMLLGQSLGDGEGEGTLQPTARIRVFVQKTWRNIMLRPWALRAPYNSREEVDKGLKKWSRINSAFLQHYLKIQKQYPRAERSLVKYYQKQFNLTPDQAKIQASFALDIAFRSHYSFHSGLDSSRNFDNKAHNPWWKIKNN